MPTAHIIAGADASGKTTLVSSLYQGGYFNSERFIGIESIISDELRNTRDILDVLTDEDGDSEPFTKANYQKAFSIASDRRAELISNKEDFVMEMTFFDDSDMAIVELLKIAGYSVIIYYIGVEKEITNAEYLIRRIRDRGHDALMHKLIERKEKSLQKLYTIIRDQNIDKTILIDNSIPDEPPHVIAVYYFGYKPFENGSDRSAAWRRYADGFWQEQDNTSILTDLMISEAKALIGSLEKTIKFFFLQTTKLRSYAWINSFISEKNEDERNIVALVYSTNTGIYDGYCNRGGHLDVCDNARWFGNYGRNDLFRTSLIAGWELKDEVLTIETLNSTYIFEIIKGKVDTSKIILAPQEIVEEVKARNATKCLHYWCKVDAPGFLDGLISVTEMPYPMNKQEAIDYISSGIAVGYDGYIARIVLGPATISNEAGLG